MLQWLADHTQNYCNSRRTSPIDQPLQPPPSVRVASRPYTRNLDSPRRRLDQLRWKIYSAAAVAAGANRLRSLSVIDVHARR